PPAEAVTVLAEETAGALALAVSQHLFDRAPVVVLAAEEDSGSQPIAADRARTLGVPLLLTPAEDGAGEEVRAELARLATQTVLTVGTAAERWAARAAGTEVVSDPGGDAT